MTNSLSIPFESNHKMPREQTYARNLTLRQMVCLQVTNSGEALAHIAIKQSARAKDPFKMQIIEDRHGS